MISTGIKKSQVLGEGRSVKILGSLLQQISKGGFAFPHRQLAAALHFRIWRSCSHDLIIVCLLLPLLLPMASSPYQAHTSCFQVWAHGDFILISPKTQGITMLGRSEVDQIIDNDNYQL